MRFGPRLSKMHAKGTSPKIMLRTKKSLPLGSRRPAGAKVMHRSQPTTTSSVWDNLADPLVRKMRFWIRRSITRSEEVKQT